MMGSPHRRAPFFVARVGSARDAGCRKQSYWVPAWKSSTSDPEEARMNKKRKVALKKHRKKTGKKISIRHQ